VEVPVPIQSSQAIVLQTHDFGEADRVIVFLTQAFGKVRVVAEGVRRIRSRQGVSLQLFATGHLVYFERSGKDLHRINEFATIRPHHKLREDFERISAASVAVELVAQGTSDQDADPDLYAVLDTGLGALETATRPLVALCCLWLHLLARLGHLPELDRCVHCQRERPADKAGVLSPGHGGLVCARCRAGMSDGLVVSAEILGFLGKAGETACEAWSDLPVTAEGHRAMVGILHRYSSHILGKPLRSAAFLEQC
jgi:DNA repair protein RecO (recombination protein O)